MQHPPLGMGLTVGTRPSTPFLRALRQPLWDTERYPAAGTLRINFFVNNTTFAVGGAKSIRDTNMTQGGSLSTPLTFDMVGFTMEFERGTIIADHNILYNTGLFTFLFANVQWLQVPDTRMPEGIGQAGAVATTVAAITPTILSNGLGLTSNFYSFLTPDRKARNIRSNEAFRVVKDYPASTAISVETDITIYLVGTLFVSL